MPSNLGCLAFFLIEPFSTDGAWRTTCVVIQAQCSEKTGQPEKAVYELIKRISSAILSLIPKTKEAGEEKINCFKKLFLPSRLATVL